MDLRIVRIGDPGALRVAVKDAGGATMWTATVPATAVEPSGWVTLEVQPFLSLVPNATYRIEVWSDADSPSPQERYFWQGKIDSAYVRGTSSVEQNPGFDFAFRTWENTTRLGRVCYVYGSDGRAADSFKSLLDANGYPTTLVPLDDVAGRDFSACDAIVVGADTGFGYEWGTPAAVETIRASGKAVVGLGYGGAGLFQQLGLSVNWGNGAIGSARGLVAADRSHPVFDAPYPIAVPRDATLDLYADPSPLIGECAPALSPEVDGIGRWPGLENYYPLAREGRHLLWGFTGSPTGMTPAGRSLFVNAVDYLASSFSLKPLCLSLHVEDALEGVAVNKVVGDVGEGPTNYTRLEIVAKLISFSPSAKDGIPVTLTIPGDVFGAPIRASTRVSDGGAQTTIPVVSPSPGRYQVTVDLSPRLLWPQKVLYYRTQVAWRFLIPEGTAPQTVSVEAQVGVPCFDPVGNGTIHILAPGAVRSLIVANRRLLFDKYADSQVTGLLQRLFSEAQGSPVTHSPRAVSYYVDRYDTRAKNWDNTAVDYTSGATANVAANAIDALIEDWYDDATQYLDLYVPFFGTIPIPIAAPNYLLLAGDDDTIPFYRYDDPYNDEQNRGVNASGNPAVWATDNDFFFTDNPYADLGGDWAEGDIELWVGRLLGETAADMLSVLEEGVDWNNGRRGGVVLASVDGWELGLEPDDGRSGEIADLYGVPALFRAKGFDVRNDDVPSSEVRLIDVMSPFEPGWNTAFVNAANDPGGMDLFFIGGHNNYDHAGIPGDDFSPTTRRARTRASTTITRSP
ncbi:MAG: hypothetical protein Kow0092_36660 [Deferrisomatales bacterium]